MDPRHHCLEAELRYGLGSFMQISWTIFTLDLLMPKSTMFLDDSDGEEEHRNIAPELLQHHMSISSTDSGPPDKSQKSRSKSLIIPPSLTVRSS